MPCLYNLCRLLYSAGKLDKDKKRKVSLPGANYQRGGKENAEFRHRRESQDSLPPHRDESQAGRSRQEREKAERKKVAA